MVLPVCWNGDTRLEKEAGLVSPKGPPKGLGLACC